MTLYEIVGTNLRRLRIERDLTLEKVGESLRIDPSRLSKLERGKGGSELVTYGRLAKFYGVQVADLFCKETGLSAAAG